MAIVTSVLVYNRVQADGRRKVREDHTDDLGRVHTIYTLIDDKADADAIMAARVAGLDAQLAAEQADRDERVAEEAANVKLDIYIKGLPDKTLTDAGFTQAEVDAVKI